jgi:phospholipase C
VKLRFVKADSEETDAENDAGQNAVDGDPHTHWHTQWQTNSPTPPHEIILELVPPSVIQGFIYLPRQDESDHGTVRKYELYIGDAADDFGQPVTAGTFESDKAKKIVHFPPRKARFIKFRAVSEINGLPWTSAAEIGVIRADDVEADGRQD